MLTPGNIQIQLAALIFGPLAHRPIGVGYLGPRPVETYLTQRQAGIRWRQHTEAPSTTVSGVSNVSAMLVLGLPSIYLKNVHGSHSRVERMVRFSVNSTFRTRLVSAALTPGDA